LIQNEPKNQDSPPYHSYLSNNPLKKALFNQYFKIKRSRSCGYALFFFFV